MKGSLIIVTFFALGIVFALFSASNAGLAEFTHLVTHSSFSYYALCALMFCVGISIGCDAEILRSFKRVNPRLMLLPVMTIVGTLAGTTAASKYHVFRKIVLKKNKIILLVLQKKLYLCKVKANENT